MHSVNHVVMPKETVNWYSDIYGQEMETVNRNVRDKIKYESKTLQPAIYKTSHETPLARVMKVRVSQLNNLTISYWCT